MSLEANKALVRRHMEEVFNNKHLDVINETVAPDFDDHTNSPDWPAGREGHRQIIALFHSAIPDLQYTIEHEVAEGGMVVIRGPYRFTHEGEFFGIAPTGKQVTTTGMHLFRIADNQPAQY